jgi:regulator of RNase E activity RraA
MTNSGELGTVARSGAPSPSACDVSDACDWLQVEAVRTGAFRPLWPGCPPVGGSLTTVRLEPAAGAPLAELLDVLAAASERIVLVDICGRAEAQGWGTVLATAARCFGVLGALVHGAARDVEGLRELGFPTYARAVYPGAMGGRLRLAAVGEPVELDGSLVAPGTYAVADASGAVFFQASRRDEVLALAIELRHREQEQLQALAAGADPRVVFGRTERPGGP